MVIATTEENPEPHNKKEPSLSSVHNESSAKHWTNDNYNVKIQTVYRAIYIDIFFNEMRGFVDCKAPI